MRSLPQTDPMEIPAQEQKTKKWFKSHLLNDEIELQDLYELEQLDLDLLMPSINRGRAVPALSLIHI